MGTTLDLQDLHYTYDDVGNILSLVDGEAIETLNYSYDALDRLTGVSGAVNESYGYNPSTGNLAYKGNEILTLAYTDADHAHAATGYNGWSYAYDDNGNMVTRVISSTTSSWFTMRRTGW